MPNEDDTAELLTTAEVCRLLHVSRSALVQWRRDGLIRAYPLPNGHFRYPSNQPTIAEARSALASRRS